MIGRRLLWSTRYCILDALVSSFVRVPARACCGLRALRVLRVRLRSRACVCLLRLCVLVPAVCLSGACGGVCVCLCPLLFALCVRFTLSLRLFAPVARASPASLFLSLVVSYGCFRPTCNCKCCLTLDVIIACVLPELMLMSSSSSCG